MTTKQISVFLDSSVILAGIYSKTGASHAVLILAELGLLKAVISEQIVIEVIRNVEKKLPDFVAHTYTLFKVIPFQLIDPAEDQLTYALGLMNEKDATILAAAFTAKAEWLLSLDKHFTDLSQDALPFVVATPGEFLQNADIPRLSE